MTLHQRYRYHWLGCVGFGQKIVFKKVSWQTNCSKVLILDLLPFEDYTFIWENRMIGLV